MRVLGDAQAVPHVAPVFETLFGQVELLAQFLRLYGIVLLKPVQGTQSTRDVVTGHAVGVGVIVDVLVPLIGTDDVGNLVIVALRVPFGTAGPERRRTEEDLRPVVAHKGIIAGHTPVFPDGMGDAGGDVQFERAVEHGDDFAGFRVDDRGRRRLLTTERALPGILRTLVAKAGRLATSSG